MFVTLLTSALILAQVQPQPAKPQAEAPAVNPVDVIKAAYTKYEFRIPMRDGKKLFTAVYVPKDDSTKYPILMKRTPYSCQPYGVDAYPSKIGPSPLFSKAGYVFVVQDVRGRWMSEGEYVNVRPHIDKKKPGDIDESTDTYDTIEFLLKNVPNHNGKVGITGISYPGFYTAAGMIDAHPALKAVSPQAPVIDWFMGDDWHHNGALFLPHVFNFMSNFGKPRPEPIKKSPFLPFDHGTPDGYDFFLKMGPLSNADARYFKGDVAFWKEVMQHGSYDDWWKARNLRPHMQNIKPAVMTVGGWFDAENLFGALETFKAVEKTSNNGNILIMGPWRHGGWEGGRDGGESLGFVQFNSKTSEFYQANIELPFFEYHLKGKGELKHPKAWVFETGTNVWRKHATWPPKECQPRELYLSDKGALSGKPQGEGFDEYISDPAKPAPFIDKVGIGMLAEYMVGDQRQAARRPDVLVYQTDVLDRDLTIAGPIQVDLYVSTTGTDSDWIVKVIDVYPDDYPDLTPTQGITASGMGGATLPVPASQAGPIRMGGFQQLVRGDVMRGKFRTSFEKPEAFTPGKPSLVKFTLQDTYHTFRPGHRLMVQVQSSWFPLVDRNPQTFVDIYTAKESDFQKATQRVYHSKEMPSRITVLVRP